MPSHWELIAMKTSIASILSTLVIPASSSMGNEDEGILYISDTFLIAVTDLYLKVV